jgi:hypothetical protein
MTWTPIGNIKGPPADLSGDLELDPPAVTGGNMTGGIIKQASGLYLKTTYAQTGPPTEPAVGTAVLVQWNPTLDYTGGLTGPTPQTGYFGPRGTISIEGVATYRYSTSLLGLGPIGFMHQMAMRNEPGSALTLTPSWGYVCNDWVQAWGATVTLNRNDTAQGGACFVDNRVFATWNNGQIDGLSGDSGNGYEHIGFLSVPYVGGRTSLKRRIGLDVADLAPDTADYFSPVFGAGYDVNEGRTIQEQIGVRIKRLAAGTRNVGVRSDSPLELLADTVTLTAKPDPAPAIRIPGTWTLNYANAGLDALIQVVPTVTFRQAANPLGGLAVLGANPILQNHGTLAGTVWPLNVLVSMAPTYRAQTTAVTATLLRSFVSNPTFGSVSGGTLTVDEHDDFAAGATVNAGATVTARRGLRILDATGAGSVTTQIGIELAPLTKGSLANMSLRSLGSQHMRHVGPVVVGADAGPTNSSVALEVNSTTGALLLPRMTTAQRDALTAANGMVIYNTTANQVQARVNGAWVAL